MMIYEDIEQGSPEWFAIKCGKISASKINDVCAKGKGITRKKYLTRLVVERMTGKVNESYQSGSMAWGEENEPVARQVYEFLRDVDVQQIAFVDHPTIENAGCSPDGLVGEDGLIEIKCPDTSTHIDYLLDGNAPKTYIKQMQFQMACTGREWCDFITYDPRMPVHLQSLIVRVERNNDAIAEIEEEVRLLNLDIDGTIEHLNRIA